MKKLIYLLVGVFLFSFNLYAKQNLNLKAGWHLLGNQGNKVTVNQFNNSNVNTIWKWNDGKWELWSPDSKIQDIASQYGLSLIDELYSGEGYWINLKNDATLSIKSSCPANYIPIATESYNYQTGGYAVINLKDFSALKNLNSYTLGGDIRSYFYNGYVFMVDAPNTGNIATFYVYKVGTGDFDQTAGTNPIANYNISRQNPHSIAFANIHKAYLTTYFDNNILIFDPLTGKTLGTIDLTPYLYVSDNGTKNKYIGAEHMIKYKGKLFVTLDRARTYYGDVQPDKSMILVINMNTDKVEKAIKVDYAPRSPQIYKGYLYFLSMGDWKAPIGTIYRINLSTLELDPNFKISPVETDANGTEYIKNFVITPEGEVFLVVNGGWGKPYNVYRILNVELYNDQNKTGLITTPVYTASSYIPDIDYVCGYIVLADRGKADIDYTTKEVKSIITPGAVVFLDINGNVVKKVMDTDLGYPPYKLGTDYNY